MTDGRKHLLDWLRDAHAMERSALDILERQENRIEHYPELQSRVRQHLETTRRQTERLEQAIELLDGDVSMLKDAAGRFMGTATAFFNAAAGDEVVKSGIASYAFEHFEIASYRALVAAAEELGETRVAEICREILREEEEMASWLEQNLPRITRQFVQRELAGAEAKR